ncbi:LOW QUALITY PROTEIN: PTEN upstream open reading frame MP31 [Peromyscus maniculatus bairdii]
MWRDSLCTAAGYALGVGTRLRSALSSRKLQP